MTFRNWLRSSREIKYQLLNQISTLQLIKTETKLNTNKLLFNSPHSYGFGNEGTLSKGFNVTKNIFSYIEG